MFIGQRYYNEVNISTIDYSVHSSYQDFEIRRMYNSEEASEIPWSYNKTKKEFRELIENSWGGKVFKFQEKSKVKKLKDDAKEKRRIYNQKGESSSRYGLREHDVQETESEAKNSEKHFSLQKQILGRKITHEFVFNEGWITAYITMNNGEKFEEQLLYWCNKEYYKEKDKKVYVDKKIDRVYEDKDVDIEFVYEILNGYKPKTKEKEYI
ncbi:MAG: hypothetical protein U9N34_08070 [Candidatus Cloacimonadota bacterium]|nr:hypothetical protein [Candidatus Cloacimonadota bacterium]